MSNKYSLFEDPYMEWVVVAEELMRVNPEATMWDLMAIMWKYKTGTDVPEEEE